MCVFILFYSVNNRWIDRLRVVVVVVAFCYCCENMFLEKAYSWQDQIELFMACWRFYLRSVHAATIELSMQHAACMWNSIFCGMFVIRVCCCYNWNEHAALQHACEIQSFVARRLATAALAVRGVWLRFFCTWYQHSFSKLSLNKVFETLCLNPLFCTWYQAFSDTASQSVNILKNFL